MRSWKDLAVSITWPFGSENGNLRKLQSAADFLKENDEVLHCQIQALMKQGNSYPRARQIAAEELQPDFDANLISEPNNILALEYLKQLKTLEALYRQTKGQRLPSVRLDDKEGIDG